MSSKEKRTAYNKAYYAANREREKARAKAFGRPYLLKKKYGLTPEALDALILGQNGLCALCFKPLGPTGQHAQKQDTPVVDHDHESGQIRGILHSECNRLLGTYERLRGLAERYLCGQ